AVTCGCVAHAARTGTAHTAESLGARCRRLVRVSVCRETHAYARRTQCRSAGHAGVRIEPVCDSAIESRGIASGRLHERHTESAQRPKQELEDFSNWTSTVKAGQGDDMYRINGAGEMLAYSAADFEDFLEPRPDMPSNMESDLKSVVTLLARNRWPFRLHATY